MRLGDPATLTYIDALEGRAFERFLAAMLRKMGYEAELTPHFDYGADIVLVREGERIAVQVKRVSKLVGADAVRAVVAAKPMYGCTGSMVITNHRFSSPAKQLAKGNDVELWDRRRLESEILSFCNLCDKRVTPRVRKWCLDRPEQFGGRVYCFDHQRDVTGLLRSA